MSLRAGFPWESMYSKGTRSNYFSTAYSPFTVLWPELDVSFSYFAAPIQKLRSWFYSITVQPISGDGSFSNPWLLVRDEMHNRNLINFIHQLPICLLTSVWVLGSTTKWSAGMELRQQIYKENDRQKHPHLAGIPRRRSNPACRIKSEHGWMPDVWSFRWHCFRDGNISFIYRRAGYDEGFISGGANNGISQAYDLYRFLISRRLLSLGVLARLSRNPHQNARLRAVGLQKAHRLV